MSRTRTPGCAAAAASTARGTSRAACRPGARKKGCTTELGHAVRGAGGERFGDGGRSELEVSHIDGEVRAQAPQRVGEARELGRGLGLAAAVVDDEQPALHQ